MTEDSGQKQRTTLGVKLTRWIFYTVLVSLVPIGLDYVVVLAVARATVAPSLAVLSEGQLYLLSCAFLAVGLGEIIGSNEKARIAKIVLAGVSTVGLIGSMGLYVASKNLGNGHFFAYPSIAFCLFSCVIATSCIAASEIGND